jgi:hypothetical protein
MTPKYWIKIVLGMFAIFIVGMVVVRGVDAGKRKVVNFAEGTSSITVPMFGAAFSVGGTQLGGIQSLRIERDAPKVIGGFHLDVTLQDGVDVDQFDNCEITVENPERIDEHTQFACLIAADSGFAALVQFGTVTFRPSGKTHRLMVPAHVVAEIQSAGHADDAQAVAEAVAAGATAEAAASEAAALAAAPGNVVIDADSSKGRVRLTINGREIVNIHGGETGGRISIDASTPPAPPAATGKP